MSVDTNLYVRVTEESKLKVLQTVNKAVKEWYLAGKRKAHKESKYSDKSMLCWMFRDEVKPLWKGVETYTYNFETFTINYKFNGEHRSIFLCFSHSYKDEIGDFEKLYVSWVCQVIQDFQYLVQLLRH
ncbi:hypothetical protein [Tenacibaculum phage PTm5]|uniref:Uncharacterized protein n=1 Tax=Tenacibaculum phage PTm5 TaxID=2547426 RepID=A0A5S9HXN3_9CAUD|nr:hypothetical protein [Tenacibaculum phage PTm5]